MKIYVASSWRNDHQQSVVGVLQSAGHDVYDFKHPTQGDAGFHWSEIDPNWQKWTTQQYRDALRHEYAQFGFNRDFNAMKECDACVLVLPCGRSAHLEAGWMKGAGRKVYAYIPDGCTIEPELMYGLLDGITSDIKEIIAMLKESEAKPMDVCRCLQNDRHGESACRDAVCNPAIWGFACKNKCVIYLHKKLDEEVRVRMDAEAKLEKYRKAIKPFVNICRDVVEACDNNKEEGTK